MNERQIEEIQDRIESRLGELEPDVDVLAVEPVAAEQLRLFIDHPNGVDLDLCERVTRHLRDLLVDWGLEVSSPGPERPLTKPEHFRCFVGRRVKVRTREEIAGRRSFTGRLTEADEGELSIDSGDGPVSIPLTAIRRSNLVPEGPEVAA